ncbi:MAG TPA: TRAP transporter substrate-binding protein [Roseateles sp.]|nr:TRAP transporter substrate-binding protein [Roseateles sp.]
MNWKFSAAATALMLAALGGATQAQTGTERTLRLGHGIAEEHPLGQGAKKFAEIIEKASGGAMKVKVYPATQLGSETQMIGALRGGVQEMLITSSAPVATLAKDYLLFDLPFLLQSEREADALLDGPVGQRLLDGLQDKNLVGLCYWENGFRHVSNSRRAVLKADDLVGLKLRVMQNPVYIDSFKALGANAVPMPFTELYTAMETKAIDAQENPVAIIYASKFYEVQKHVTLTKHAYAPYVVLVGKSFWDKLAQPERERLRKGCQEARDFQRATSRRMTAQQLEQLKSQGMTVSELAPGEAERMRSRLQPVLERYTQEIGAPLVAEAQRAIAAVRSKP